MFILWTLHTHMENTQALTHTHTSTHAKKSITSADKNWRRVPNIHWTHTKMSWVLYMFDVESADNFGLVMLLWLRHFFYPIFGCFSVLPVWWIYEWKWSNMKFGEEKRQIFIGGGWWRKWSGNANIIGQNSGEKETRKWSETEKWKRYVSIFDCNQQQQ